MQLHDEQRWDRGRRQQIKLNPTTSVLRHQVGDRIELSEQDFVQVSEAFFAEIESKFV